MNSWRSAKRRVLRRMAAPLIASVILFACGDGGGGAHDHSAHEGMPGMEMPGMDGSATTAVRSDSSLDATLRAPNTFVIADLETVSPEERDVPMPFEASGLLTYDPRAISSVSARAAGWIDRLHVKYRFQTVKRGEPLMALYSRELVTEQENYLFLLRQEPKDVILVSAAEKRLTLLGFAPEEITQLRNTGIVQKAVTYFSPASGHLHENDRGDPMVPDGSMPGTGQQNLLLREGAYVEKGRTLFTIYGTGTVLALLNMHPDDGQDRIALGQRVSVRIDGSHSPQLEGRVDLVEPVYRDGASFVSLRVYLPNPGDSLRIGSRVTAVIDGPPARAWTVPASAVVSTGLHRYVFVREAGGFRPREVITGVRSGEWIELRSGLDLQQAIARNAQLLIDSESFLKATSP